MSNTEIDWQRAHAELVRIAKQRGELDFEEGEWMPLALRTGVHTALGFGSFSEYAERHLGYKPRWTAERLRVAEALEHLPEMVEALRCGAIKLFQSLRARGATESEARSAVKTHVGQSSPMVRK